jgi:sterol desaturase/sphingolipid hydroxylase (fatty acid hydroxylase superfamily)
VDDSDGESSGAQARERHDRTRRRWRLVGWAVVVVLAGALATERLRHLDEVGSFFSAETLAHTGEAVWSAWRASVLNPWYLALVVALVVLERFFAADPRGGTLTRGGAVDLVWLLAFPLTSLTIVALYLGALDALYLDDLGGRVIDLPDAIGWPAAIVVAFLVGDLFNWATHLVRHKIPTFWYFHAVHHSQPQMSVLTDNRVHFVEAMVSGTLVFVPSMLLGLGGEVSILVALSTVYFTGFTHANLRTNLGPLRYLVITPQFHRVHHSYAPEHIDKNFGAVLSVWDRLFRTAYLGEDEYPATGISDRSFPLVDRTRPTTLVRGYLRQLAYPFRQVGADIVRFDLGRGRPRPPARVAVEPPGA